MARRGRGFDPGRRAGPPPGERRHGPETLRVMRGTVVGTHGDDVFVELGPRQQGVLSRRAFEVPPAAGDVHDFTLRGQEEGLWALTLAESGALAAWEDMVEGLLVPGRVVREAVGGLECKVGDLHAFLPRSHTGLPRGESVGLLVGRTFTVEVLEVDPGRQRVLVSRKLVLRRERESERQRAVAALRPGALVQGRVSRLEPYGAFVRFGPGLEGLVHVSNLSHERLAHPRQVVQQGQALTARVLWVRQGGKRIALGVKQVGASPWAAFAERHGPGDVVDGTVSAVRDWGVLVAIPAPGPAQPGWVVEGLLHASECALGPGRSPRQAFAEGQDVSVRVAALDARAERLSLSRLASHGAPLLPGEGAARREFESWEGAAEAPKGRSLGALLRSALDPRESPRSETG